METTTLSSKGQVVIPEKIRKDFEIGSSFVVSKVDEMIVFKPVKGLTSNEKKELQEINRVWNEIDAGKAKAYTEKEFFKAMKQW